MNYIRSKKVYRVYRERKKPDGWFADKVLNGIHGLKWINVIKYETLSY